MIRSDEKGNFIEMSIADGAITIQASGPDVHESADVFFRFRNQWVIENEPPATLDGRGKEFEVIVVAFLSGIEVSDTPYDYEDSRDAGKTWVLWERVAQALGYENKVKPYVVY